MVRARRSSNAPFVEPDPFAVCLYDINDRVESAQMPRRKLHRAGAAGGRVAGIGDSTFILGYPRGEHRRR